MQLSQEQLQAVRYYIGDITGLPDTPFWQENKAYCVLNALFYPDITTETVRIREGKFLNPAVLADIENLKQVLQNLLSVCSQFPAKQHLQSYRVERFVDYQMLKQAGKTISFTSTSEYGFLKAYQDREGIVLMRFQIPAGTPCIIMKEILSYYAKPEEQEILLPPALHLQITEIPLTNAEMQILDAKGNPPVISCMAEVSPSAAEYSKMQKLPADTILSAKNVYNALQNHQKPNINDVKNYVQFKKILTENILSEFMTECDFFLKST